MSIYLSISALSYLLGSIPFGYLLMQIFCGEDVRQTGSGNIGATNVSRTSPALGALTLLLDAAKGTAAVVFAYLLSDRTHSGGSSYKEIALAALCATAGHMFPVWLKFQGGKGVATGLGAFAVIAPKSLLVAAAIFFLAVLTSRFVSLGSILAVAAFPFLVVFFHEYGGDHAAISLIFFSSLLIVARHHENIRRLLAGAENRFGAKSR
ncbi:MAG TPA: glycerol-3-phosphate 1-O-acyltransferase PlsY [Candidatus Sulfotelmatobacter sp.]